MVKAVLVLDGTCAMCGRYPPVPNSRWISVGCARSARTSPFVLNAVSASERSVIKGIAKCSAATIHTVVRSLCSAAAKTATLSNDHRATCISLAARLLSAVADSGVHTPDTVVRCCQVPYFCARPLFVLHVSARSGACPHLCLARVYTTAVVMPLRLCI